MKMIVKGIFFLMGLLIGLLPLAADGATISVDSAQVAMGQSFQVGVRLKNNTDVISALTVPLEFNSPFLRVDSVSFASSILPSSFNGTADIDNAAHTVRVSYIPDQFSTPLPTISTAQGLIGTIHFTVLPGASVGYVPIDSLYRDSIINFGGNNIHYWVRVEFSNQAGTVSILPSVTPGGVQIMILTDIEDDNNGLLPNHFELVQNYPNPFNPSTTIEFALPRAGHVSLKVYNVVGQEVAVLVDAHKSAGNYSIEFGSENFPSGVYFYKLVHQEGSETRKMMLVK